MPLTAPEEVDKEITRILSDFPQSGAATVPLDEALGRILAQDILADRDQPPFNRSAMDGITINWRSLAEGAQQFTSLGILAAGQDPHPFTQAEQIPDLASCVEIMTGAAVPPGFDTVIRYEDLTSSQGPDGAKVFRLTGVLDDSDVSGGSGGVKDSPKSQDPPNRRSPKKSLSPGANIHPQAADYHQGQVILGAGEIITSSHIAILASCGCTRVPSIPLPVIRILATGDELVDPSAPPLPHQIRGSNHLSLSAELTAWGFTPKRINICDDRPEALEAEISSAIQDAQILILTGAVSKGLYDEIPHLLTTLGVTIHIHGVSQRPGKPLLIGEYSTPEGQKKLIMALPGNPVSALVNLRRYLVPALISRFTGYSDPGSGLTIPPGAEPGSESGSGFTTRPQPNTNPKPGPRRRASRWLAAQGFRLPLGQDLAFSPSLTYYPGVQVIATEQGLLAYPVQGNGSGDFFHLSKTSGFIIIPAKENLTKAGDLVHYLPWGV